MSRTQPPTARSERWPHPCHCAPGSAADGWHEQRCPKCLEYELEQWRAMGERLSAYLARTRVGSDN